MVFHNCTLTINCCAALLFFEELPAANLTAAFVDVANEAVEGGASKETSYEPGLHKILSQSSNGQTEFLSEVDLPRRNGS